MSLWAESKGLWLTNLFSGVYHVFDDSPQKRDSQQMQYLQFISWYLMKDPEFLETPSLYI